MSQTKRIVCIKHQPQSRLIVRYSGESQCDASLVVRAEGGGGELF